MIEDIESSNKAYFDRLKSRDYKCPCGKSYLSYAALFTHIKQKHQGKPPGKISKPGGTYQKRGRPSLKTKALQNSQQKTLKINEKNSSNSSLNFENSLQKDKIQNHSQYPNKSFSDAKILENICMVMNEVPSQSRRRIHLNEMQAFTEMLVIIKREGDESMKRNDGRIVDCLMQYFSCVSSHLQWGQFQQLFILLILYLQFIMDEQNNKEIIKTGGVDILCEYINDFIQNHLQALAEYYQLENLQVMREHVAIGVFGNVFKWMMERGYTKYVIGASSEMNSKCHDEQQYPQV